MTNNQICFSVIGTGNLAHFFTKKLCEAGYIFLGVWARNTKNAQDFAKQYAGIPYQFLNEISDAKNHLCLLAINDDAIGSIATQLALEKTILIHHSGATTLDSLGNQNKGKAILWPIYSITGSENTSQSNIPIAIETNAKDVADVIFPIAQKLTQNTFIVDAQQRQHLHLSAVFANNFTNHLFALAQKICVDKNLSFDHLLPIIEQSIERLKLHPAKDLQTGPAKRNDLITLSKHKELLSTHPDWQKVYESLSLSIRNMYTASKD